MNDPTTRLARLPLRQFPLAGKLILGFGLICAVLAASGGVFFFSLRSIENLNAAERSSALGEVTSLHLVGKNLGLLQAEVFRHVVATAPEEAQRHEQVLARLAGTNADVLMKFEKAIESEAEKELCAQVLQDRKAYSDRTEHVLALSRAKRNAEAATFALTTQVPAYDQYQVALDALLRFEEAKGRGIAAATTGRIKQAIVTGNLLIALAIVIVLGTGTAVSRMVRTLRQDKRSLQTEVEQHEQAEQALREGEARYRLLVDHSPDAIFVVCDEKIVFVNPATLKLLGADRPGQVIGLSLPQIVHPDERAEVARRQREVAEGKQPPTIDRRLLRLDGSTVEVEARIISFLYEGKPALQATARDNTERKGAAEKLKAQEKQYRLLFDDNPTPMWVYDVQSLNILAVNQAAISNYGYSREEFLSRTLRDMRPSEDVTSLAKFISDASAASNYGGEWRHLKKDGSVITAAVYSSPIVFDNKEARMALALDLTERVEAERKVRESEANLAFAQQVAGVGSWEYQFTADGRIDQENLLWSEEAYRLFGLPSEVQITSVAFFQAVHPDDRAFVGGRFTAFLEDKGPFQADYRIVRPDGTERIVSAVAEKILDSETGRPIKVVGTFVDITERRAVEKQLRAAEAKYRSIFDNASEGIFQSNLAGKFLVVNPAAARIFDFASPEEMVRERSDITRQSYVNPKRREDFLRLIEEHGVVNGFECEVYRKDGSQVWISENARAVRDAQGTTLYFEGTLQDITHRKQAEERLREQADLLDLAHDAIMACDMNDRIEFWNHGAEVLYGWTAEEAHGRLSGGFLHHEEPLDIVGAQRALLETGVWSGECRHLTKQGGTAVVRSRWTLVRDEQGQPKSKLIINTDITEQKKIEEQFLRAQRLESIGTLASGVAHDLNNILLPIMMAAPILRGEMDPADREKFLDIVESSAHRGADIIKQVLTFARGADGDRILLQPIYLLEEVSKIASQTFPKSITLRTVYEENIRSLEADPTQLHQVLLNLCINARDAMPKGGELCLAAENFDVDEHYASMTPDATAGPHVLLQVTDSGSGIPGDVIAKIFDPFFTTKSIGRGTGLGLSTVAGIVKSHGGFIDLYSEPGHTSFKIFLPAKNTFDASASLEADVMIPRGSGQTILLVDDEPIIREIAQLILENNGYTVLVAEDGPTALAVFAQQRGHIAAVVTDLAMPLMDGLMLVRTLRRIEPGLKVIVSTGRTDDPQAAEIAGLNVDGCLTKPYTTRNLLIKLSHVLHSDILNGAEPDNLGTHAAAHAGDGGPRHRELVPLA